MIPDLKGIGTGDFTKAVEAIPRGEDGRRALRRSSNTGRSHRRSTRNGAPLHRMTLEPPTAIRSVEILPIPGIDSRRIGHFVHSKPGPLDLETLDGDLERLYGTGLFENVQFDLAGTGPERDLRIEATPKSWGPTYMRTGLNFSGDLNGTATFGILALVDAAEMNRFGAQWKTALEFGTDSSLNSTFYQPLGYGSDAFFSPRPQDLAGYAADLFTPDTNDRIAEYRVRRVAGGLDLVYDFGTFAEVRGGVEWGT